MLRITTWVIWALPSMRASKSLLYRMSSRDAVATRAVAERGKSSIRAISPNASPGPSVRRTYSPLAVACEISTEPSTTTKRARPGSPSWKTISPELYPFSRKRAPSLARRRRGRPANSGERASSGGRRACSGSSAQARHRSRYCWNMARTIAEGDDGGATRPVSFPASRGNRPTSARSTARSKAGMARDESHATVEGDVRPCPFDQDDQTVAEADEEDDV